MQPDPLDAHLTEAQLRREGPWVQPPMEVRRKLIEMERQRRIARCLPPEMTRPGDSPDPS